MGIIFLITKNIFSKKKVKSYNNVKKKIFYIISKRYYFCNLKLSGPLDKSVKLALSKGDSGVCGDVKTINNKNKYQIIAIKNDFTIKHNILNSKFKILLNSNVINNKLAGKLMDNFLRKCNTIEEFYSLSDPNKLKMFEFIYNYHVVIYIYNTTVTYFTLISHLTYKDDGLFIFKNVKGCVDCLPVGKQYKSDFNPLIEVDNTVLNSKNEPEINFLNCEIKGKVKGKICVKSKILNSFKKDNNINSEEDLLDYVANKCFVVKSLDKKSVELED